MTTVEQWALFIFNASVHDKASHWTPLARIDDGVDFVLTPSTEYEALPTVVGDLTLLNPRSTGPSQIALGVSAAVGPHRVVHRDSAASVVGWNKSFYSYKWIRA